MFLWSYRSTFYLNFEKMRPFCLVRLKINEPVARNPKYSWISLCVTRKNFISFCPRALQSEWAKTEIIFEMEVKHFMRTFSMSEYVMNLSDGESTTNTPVAVAARTSVLNPNWELLWINCIQLTGIKQFWQHCCKISSTQISELNRKTKMGWMSKTRDRERVEREREREWKKRVVFSANEIKFVVLVEWRDQLK